MSAEKAGPAERPGETEAFADAFATGGPPMRVLAIDVIPDAIDMIRRRTGAEVIEAPFAALTLARLAQWTPDAVVAPLVGTGFDIIDLGQRLAGLAFGGRLYAVAEPMPDADAIIREVHETCPDLAFEIIAFRPG